MECIGLYLYSNTLFYCILLYCASWILFLTDWRSVATLHRKIYQCHFSNSNYSLRVFVTFWQLSQNFKFFFMISLFCPAKVWKKCKNLYFWLDYSYIGAYITHIINREIRNRCLKVGQFPLFLFQHPGKGFYIPFSGKGWKMKKWKTGGRHE